MTDEKSVEFAGGGMQNLVNAANVAAHLLLKVAYDLVGFLIRAFDDHFDPAIGEVSDVAGHVVTHGDVLCRIAKTDPLHAPAEMA